MNKIEHLLVCAAEECNEVGQRFTKALRFGLREVQEGQLLNNAQRIFVELADLLAVIEMLEEEGAVEASSDEFLAWFDAMVKSKKEKMDRLTEYSISCGTVTA